MLKTRDTIHPVPSTALVYLIATAGHSLMHPSLAGTAIGIGVVLMVGRAGR
jgi:hypothetical protein